MLSQGGARDSAGCYSSHRALQTPTGPKWMGHASIAPTYLDLHYRGTSTDRAGLARLNELGKMGADWRADLDE